MIFRDVKVVKKILKWATSRNKCVCDMDRRIEEGWTSVSVKSLILYKIGSIW